MFHVALTVVHILICFFLIIVVLLQSGKAADLAGAFGGMGSQTVFGPRGTATVLSKATTVAASLFMITSLALAISSHITSQGANSVLRNRRTPAPVVQKNNPAPKPAPAPSGTKK
jgi:preprotein translocase subunit SecG